MQEVVGKAIESLRQCEDVKSLKTAMRKIATDPDCTALPEEFRKPIRREYQRQMFCFTARKLADGVYAKKGYEHIQC